MTQTGTGSDSTRGSSAWKVSPFDYEEQAKPLYRNGFSLKSVYVTVRDGTRLAVDFYLPTDLSSKTRLPSIVLFTPYYRRWKVKQGSKVGATHYAYAPNFFVPYGYAVVIVDVRGTGASFGARRGFRSPIERMDFYDIADWITMQSWSDGKIGSTGVSYVGAAADFLATTGHPAVKAIIPTYAVWDTYTDFFYSGGLMCRTITHGYSDVTTALDSDDRATVASHPYFSDPMFDGPAPVDADLDSTLLRAAIAEHGANFDMMEFVNQRPCRDSGSIGDRSMTCEIISPSYYVTEERHQVATYAVSGWRDGYGYSDAAVRRFLSLKNTKNKLLLGPWDHGAMTNASPGRRSSEPQFEKHMEYLRFFDAHLKGTADSYEQEEPIHYFTMIAEKWQSSKSWPVPGTSSSELFFDSKGALSGIPTVRGGRCNYKVDFGCETGIDTRYERLGSQAVDEYYGSWDGRDDRMLVYTSSPAAADVEITGHPEAVVWLSTTASDGAIFVYLEDIEPSGRRHYITEGILRLLHRKVSECPDHDRTIGPYRTYYLEDITRVVPNAEMELRIGLLPTSWLLKAGHRIGVAIAGADSRHFSRVPVGETPILTVHSDVDKPSRIILPLINPPAKVFE
ncbi:MAG: CocE/NonD family hydrolase [Mesorhizobium sp.]|uniref:CocE/NonD family hydrolase n=1 Tax=Mesorhizobium sp. TaxID=1871066 RepID=UPI000FE70404|nr:CocE/NonD family hydrolase [Mesorhizobium sp.]RWK47253.1 MAG: CocE/NonD family hydrolase [Mesorhizobium sp.]